MGPQNPVNGPAHTNASTPTFTNIFSGFPPFSALPQSPILVWILGVLVFLFKLGFPTLTNLERFELMSAPPSTALLITRCWIANQLFFGSLYYKPASPIQLHSPRIYQLYLYDYILLSIVSISIWLFAYGYLHSYQLGSIMIEMSPTTFPFSISCQTPVLFCSTILGSGIWRNFYLFLVNR